MSQSFFSRHANFAKLSVKIFAKLSQFILGTGVSGPQVTILDSSMITPVQGHCHEIQIPRTPLKGVNI